MALWLMILFFFLGPMQSGILCFCLNLIIIVLLMDIISNLPDNLIGFILGKLPLIDSVKTSALSKSWRLRWTSLSGLILDQDFYADISRRIDGIPLEHANIVDSLVLQHGGSLREFYLFIPYYDQPSCSLFRYSIGCVVRSRCLERLLLVGANILGLALPSSIFLAVNLKHLEIVNFEFRPPSWFDGFPNLTCLMLSSGAAAIDKISHFVSVCPQLEKVRLLFVNFDGDLDQNVHLKLDLIAPKLIHLCIHGKFLHIAVSNAQILETISLHFYSLPEADASGTADICKFFNYSLQLQHISLTGRLCKLLGTCRVIHTLPRFGRMKAFEFFRMTLQDLDELRCFTRFLACSVNVKWLILKIGKCETAQPADPLELVTMAEKYINANLGELVRVDLFGITCTKIEMKIIELLLRFSPMLEVMCIDCNPKVGENVELQFDKAMENFYQASTKATIRLTCTPDPPPV